MVLSGPQPGQKRASEAHTPTPGIASSSEPSSKKPRFHHSNPLILARDGSDEEDDSILDLDVIGSRVRNRKAVNLDGYDSDSEHENADARVARKIKEAGLAARKERADDIFAEEGKPQSEEDDRFAQGRPKKEVRFLEMDDIEGQETVNKSGKDDLDDSSSEGATDDEGRAQLDSDLDEELGAGAKKRHAPRLDAFNMRTENEEGRFDENLNYVRKAADPDAVHDSWLKGVSKREVKRAARMHALREEEVREKETAEEAVPTSEHLATLISHLRKSETVLEALQRHNKSKPKQQRPRRGKAERNGKDADRREESQSEAEAERERVVAIEALTGAADKLSYRGLPGVSDIYDIERELLIRHYKHETGKPWTETIKPTEDDQWEFRWVSDEGEGVTNGPYTANQMKAWTDAGYFDVGVSVEYRRVGEGEWAKTADFN